MYTISKELLKEAEQSVLIKKYTKFVEVLNETNLPPNVFDPLNPKSVDELQLIREVSRDLQNKKDEDIRKQLAEKEAATAPESENTETVAEKEAEKEVEKEDS